MYIGVLGGYKRRIHVGLICNCISMCALEVSRYRYNICVLIIPRPACCTHYTYSLRIIGPNSPVLRICRHLPAVKAASFTLMTILFPLSGIYRQSSFDDYSGSEQLITRAVLIQTIISLNTIIANGYTSIWWRLTLRQCMCSRRFQDVSMTWLAAKQDMAW